MTEPLNRTSSFQICDEFKNNQTFLFVQCVHVPERERRDPHPSHRVFKVAAAAAAAAAAIIESFFFHTCGKNKI